MTPLFLPLAAAAGPVAWLARLAIPARISRGEAGAPKSRAPPSFGDSHSPHAPTFEEASARRPPLPLPQP